MKVVVGIDEHLAQTGGTRDALDALPRETLHPELDDAALYGPVGEFVRAVAPYTEADPAGVLFNALAAVGCMCGPTAGMAVSGQPEPPRLFVGTVGETGVGRKGTAQRVTEALLVRVDADFVAGHTASGLSTGEGLIYHVRDSVTRKVPRREHGVTTYEDVTEEGVADKRVLVVEDEFAATLKRMAERTSTLSPLLRAAYDGRPLRTLTRLAPMAATGAHVCLAVQITPAELHECLQSVEHVNGFANRFLWAAVRQQRELPEGEFLPRDQLDRIAGKIRHAVDFARGLTGEGAILRRDRDAKAAWEAIYRKCNADLRDASSDVLRGLLARGTTHVLRVAALFALLDCTTTVRVDHLEAAAAVVDYSVASVLHIWGKRPERGALARLVGAHVAAGAPMSRSQQFQVFNGHLRAAQLDRLVQDAERRGLLAKDGKTKAWTATPAAIRKNSQDSHAFSDEGA